MHVSSLVHFTNMILFLYRANNKPHFNPREGRGAMADIEVAQLAYRVEDD